MKAWQREARILRADDQVLKRYRLERRDEGDLAHFAVTGGSAPYTLTLSKSWAADPECSCPDGQNRGVRGYCKHAMAAMLREPDLRCQLLEAYLE